MSSHGQKPRRMPGMTGLYVLVALVSTAIVFAVYFLARSFYGAGYGYAADGMALWAVRAPLRALVIIGDFVEFALLRWGIWVAIGAVVILIVTLLFDGQGWAKTAQKLILGVVLVFVAALVLRELAVWLLDILAPYTHNPPPGGW